MFLGGSGHIQTELAGLGGKRGDKSRDVHDLHTLFPKDALQIEVLGIEDAPYFTSPVVVYPGTPHPPAAVGDVKLMAVTPGTALGNLRSLEVHAPAAQVAFDQLGNGTALNKGCQYLDRQAQVRRNAGHIGFRTGDVHDKGVAGVHRLAVERREPYTHARGYKHRILSIRTQFHPVQVLLLK